MNEFEGIAPHSSTRSLAERLMDFLESRREADQLDSASGLIVELRASSGYHELIGPYPKDTADAFVAIEHLRSEEDSDEPPNQYFIRLLFPASHAMPPGTPRTVPSYSTKD